MTLDRLKIANVLLRISRLYFGTHHLKNDVRIYAITSLSLILGCSIFQSGWSRSSIGTRAQIETWQTAEISLSTIRVYRTQSNRTQCFAKFRLCFDDSVCPTDDSRLK